MAKDKNELEEAYSDLQERAFLLGTKFAFVNLKEQGELYDASANRYDKLRKAAKKYWRDIDTEIDG